MSDVNFDELVRSNIQEVLAAVAQQHPGTPAPEASQSQLHQQGAKRFAPSQLLQYYKPANVPRRLVHVQIFVCRRESGEEVDSSSNGMLDSKLLEVPQNSEATIRLLKARLKSVEKQLGVVASANQGADVPGCDVDAICVSGVHVEAWSCSHYNARP